MKYYISTYKNKKHLHAGTKAVQDCSKILERLGYKAVFWRTDFPLHIIKYFNEILFLLRLLHHTKEDDVVLLQWPDYDIKFYKLWYIVLKRRRNFQILIHDINSLRNFKKAGNKTNEIRFFLMAKLIVAHTPKMKHYLISLGIKESKIRILTSFDYLTTNKSCTQRRNSGSVVYAGNLEKSVFLRYLTRNSIGKEVSIKCYGKKSDKLGDACKYENFFQPDDVTVLDGSWGLVWDGTSIETCEGDFGNYLRYNSPHKSSLYLAAGIPVIVWEQSGLAEYITNKRLGIVVKSLIDIPTTISSLPDESYVDIIKNVITEGEDIRNGKHLQNVLSEIDEE